MAWWDWITLADDHIVVGERRLPILAFEHGRPTPREGERTWGIAWIPAGESHVTVSVFCEYNKPEAVFCNIVLYEPSPMKRGWETDDWDLCWTGEPDIRRYRRCRIGPSGTNYLAEDLKRSRRTSASITSPESLFDLLAFASTIELIEPQEEHHE